MPTRRRAVLFLIALALLALYLQGQRQGGGQLRRLLGQRRMRGTGREQQKQGK